MIARSFAMRLHRRCEIQENPERIERSNEMRVLFALALLILSLNLKATAQPQSIPGLISKRETDLLTYEDKLAAYDAEQAVLSSEWGTEGYNWTGPNGAYGTIIVQGSLPQADGKRHCRRFIHIVHHANDAGANPTFQGVVCQGEGAEWRPR
jgi:surface antigen